MSLAHLPNPVTANKSTAGSCISKKLYFLLQHHSFTKTFFKMADTVNNNNDDLIISYLKIRRAIGWLGLLLPFMLLTGNIIVNKLNILNSNFFIKLSCYTKPYQAQDSFKASISHYYYSTVGELFTGVLCAVALFMFCYRGHKLRAGEKGLSDNAMANLTGFFALGVVVFPTGAGGCIGDNMRIFLSSTYTGYIHFGFASLFFISLALMSMVNFRRTEVRKQFGKLKNHKTYLICGIGMLACLALIFIYSMWIEKMDIKWLNSINPVFCLEAIALIFFGTSWLIKGQLDIPGAVKKMFTKK